MRKFMKKFFEHIKIDKTIYYTFISSSVIFFFTILLVAIEYRNLPPVLPLFNQLPWGESRLGEKNQLLIPISIVLVVGITNSIVSSFVYNSQPLITRILFITMFLVSLFTLLFIIRTFLLVL